MGDYADDQIRAALAAEQPGRARLWEAIKAEVEKAPPLGDEQRDRLRVLLTSRIPPRPPKLAPAVAPALPLRPPKPRRGSPQTTTATPVTTEIAA